MVGGNYLIFLIIGKLEIINSWPTMSFKPFLMSISLKVDSKF